MTIDEINKAISYLTPKDKGFISDGYHTFDELYEHRCLLFAVLCNWLIQDPCGFDIFKARSHRDGTRWDGWISVCMVLPVGQISYHLPESYWDKLHIPGYDIAPIEFDGHTSNDVLERLHTLF